MVSRKIVFGAILAVFLLGACLPAAPQAGPAGSSPAAAGNRSVAIRSEAQVRGISYSAPEASPGEAQPAGTEGLVVEQEAALGPDTFPAGVSPLTGLAVEDPSRLALPPALISVTNFPVSARPQAGLSYSPYVFELFIGEGMTRFLAMFYGDYPVPAEAAQDQADQGQAVVAAEPKARNAVGPIRSGRLPYGSLSELYNGFLVMASASADVKSQLGGSTTVFGSDSDDINSALIDVTQLDKIARAQATGSTSQKFNLTGNLFQAAAPQGGKSAPQAWIFYSWLNQVLWKYDPASGAYLRHQDNADGSGKFIQSTDRLNGEPLAYENVIVLFAQHHVKNRAGTLIDVDLLYTSNYAYLLRDGRLYPLRWTTVNGEYEKSTGLLRPIRFIDEKGNPFPLKPGSTWVEIVDITTTLQEVEGGKWKFRFYAPAVPK